MPPLDGLLETALYVDDPVRSATFYRKLFSFEIIVESERLIAMAMPGRQVLLLFKKGLSSTLPVPHDGKGQTHLAWAIPADSLTDWERRLAELALPILERTEWPRGGTSLYFRDPDGHLLELATPGVWTIY
jgi:catechol 2,3-dioxygenase-like lactoylglutathione lyase family enzyme